MANKFLIAILVSCAPILVLSGKIWWITDLHFDLNGDKLPSVPFCAWTPPSEFHSGLKMMCKEEAKPDFVIISGDFIHTPERTPDEHSRKNTIATIQTVIDMVSDKFPGVPILPCIGNHEYDDPYKPYPDPKWKKWLYIPLSEMWKEWISEDTFQLFRNYGFYSKVYNGSSTSDLRVIVLNTTPLSWYWQILALDKALFDEAELQLTWLDQELAAANKSNQSVYIIGHHPMSGMYMGGLDLNDFVPLFMLRYATIVQKYKDIIKAQFSGHEHYDEFRVMRECRLKPYPRPIAEQTCRGDPMAVVFVGHCMSNCRDPGVRLWKYDDQTFDLVDYNQYGYSNQNETWTLRYNFQETYADMPDMKPASFQAEIDRMSKDNGRFEGFLRRRWQDGEGGQGESSDGVCKRFQLCNLSFGANIGDFLSCAYYGYDKMIEKSIPRKGPDFQPKILLVREHELEDNIVIEDNVVKEDNVVIEVV